MKKIALSAVLAVVALVALAGLWAGEALRPKLYAARGTFYYWFHGLENSAGFGDWGGPDPLWCFKEELWDTLPEDFPKRVVRRLRDVYGMGADKQADAETAIQSIAFCHTSISFTWQELISISHDPHLAADVANSAMDILAELDLQRQEATKEKMIAQLSKSHESAQRDKDAFARRMASAKTVDRLETLVDDGKWPLPKYRQMLFIY